MVLKFSVNCIKVLKRSEFKLIYVDSCLALPTACFKLNDLYSWLSSCFTSLNLFLLLSIANQTHRIKSIFNGYSVLPVEIIKVTVVFNATLSLTYFPIRIITALKFK